LVDLAITRGRADLIGGTKSFLQHCSATLTKVDVTESAGIDDKFLAHLASRCPILREFIASKSTPGVSDAGVSGMLQYGSSLLEVFELEEVKIVQSPRDVVSVFGDFVRKHDSLVTLSVYGDELTTTSLLRVLRHCPRLKTFKLDVASTFELTSILINDIAFLCPCLVRIMMYCDHNAVTLLFEKIRSLQSINGMWFRSIEFM
jgi:hypothetical protein